MNPVCSRLVAVKKTTTKKKNPALSMAGHKHTVVPIGVGEKEKSPMGTIPAICRP